MLVLVLALALSVPLPCPPGASSFALALIRRYSIVGVHVESWPNMVVDNVVGGSESEGFALAMPPCLDGSGVEEGEEGEEGEKTSLGVASSRPLSELLDEEMLVRGNEAHSCVIGMIALTNDHNFRSCVSISHYFGWKVGCPPPISPPLAPCPPTPGPLLALKVRSNILLSCFAELTSRPLFGYSLCCCFLAACFAVAAHLLGRTQTWRSSTMTHPTRAYPTSPSPTTLSAQSSTAVATHRCCCSLLPCYVSSVAQSNWAELLFKSGELLLVLMQSS